MLMKMSRWKQDVPFKHLTAVVLRVSNDPSFNERVKWNITIKMSPSGTGSPLVYSAYEVNLKAFIKEHVEFTALLVTLKDPEHRGEERCAVITPSDSRVALVLGHKVLRKGQHLHFKCPPRYKCTCRTLISATSKLSVC